MGRHSIRIPVLLCLLTLAGGVRAQVADRVHFAARGVEEQLLGLADWCEENGLRRERHVLVEAMLGFSPNDPALRKEAGYARVGDADWSRPRSFRVPRRTKAELLPEYRRRLGEAEESVLALARAIDEAGPAISSGTIHRMLAPLVRLFPRSALLRKANGEERRNAKWRLVESRRARDRGRRLQDSARLLVSGTPKPAAAELTEVEKGLGVKFTAARELPGVRVLGTVHRSEIDAAARLAAATVKLFRMTFGPGISTWDGFTVVLLEDANDRDTFLHFFPGIDDDARRHASRLSSMWVPDTATVGIWAPLRELRTEFVARQVLAMLLLKTFGVSSKHGALHEGVGLLLGHKLTGRRGTWFIKRSRYSKEEFSREALEKSGSWFDLVHKQRKKRPASYRSLFSRDVNTMEPEDVLEGYVFAAWLIQARPREAADFLRRIGGGESCEEASRAMWGRSLPELEGHVGRWVSEIR